jgi:hypothetical protein
MAQVLIDLLSASERAWQQPGRGQLSSGGHASCTGAGGQQATARGLAPVLLCQTGSLLASRGSTLRTHIVNL